MENIGYYNGKFDLIEKMTVPMNDRAMYFGDGVYDATYSVNRTIFALEDHLDRFYNSCRLLEIPAPMPCEELKKTPQSVCLLGSYKRNRNTQSRFPRLAL